jgi:hypothetical protein
MQMSSRLVRGLVVKLSLNMVKMMVAWLLLEMACVARAYTSAGYNLQRRVAKEVVPKHIPNPKLLGWWRPSQLLLCCWLVKSQFR